jgi:hypothetical protein
MGQGEEGHGMGIMRDPGSKLIGDSACDMMEVGG